MINQRAQAREHGQSKRIGRGREQNKERSSARGKQMTARQREAGSARFDPGLFAHFFWQQSLIFRSLSFRRPKNWPAVAGIFTQPPIQNINQYFSSRSSFGLCFCVYQVKRFSFIKSNQFRLVLIFKTRTKHQTNQQTTTNSSQIFIPSFIANETLLNLVGRLSLVNGDKKKLLEMVQRSELVQLNPQFLSKGLLKRVSIVERRNRKRSNKAESKNLTRGNRSEQTKQHTTTNENEKRVFVF